MHAYFVLEMLTHRSISYVILNYTSESVGKKTKVKAQETKLCFDYFC